MRIIKFEDMEVHKAKISAMIFPDLDLGEGGDNGGAPGKAGERLAQLEMNLEKAKREAEAVRVKAAEDAENVRAQAEKDAAQALVAAEEEGRRIAEQAAKDAETGKKEGFAAGYSSGEEQGYQKGYDDGYQKGKAAALDETKGTVSMMMEVIEKLKAYHIEILTEAQKDIATMALSVARKVLQKEIMTDPMTVVSIVKAALAKVSFKKQFLVYVNPLDLEVINSAGDEVRAVLDNYELLEFRANPQVEAGGCVVQTESGAVDAQIDRQFDEVKEAVMKAMEGNGK